jgi:hypothetical protein
LLKREIWWKSRVLERLEHQTELVRRACEEPRGVWFESLPSIAYLEYFGAGLLRRSKELQGILEKWVALMPVVYPMPVLHEKDLNDPSAYCPAGFFCNAEDMGQLGLSSGRFVRVLPARQYLCCICPQDGSARIDTELSLAPLRETSEKMNLRCIGDVFFMSFAVTSAADSTQRLYYQVLMPVSPKV